MLPISKFLLFSIIPLASCTGITSLAEVINNMRQGSGRPPLCSSEDLNTGANEHLQDWAGLGFQGVPTEPILNKILARGVKAINAKAITVMVSNPNSFASAVGPTDRSAIIGDYTHVGVFSRPSGTQTAWVIVLAKVKGSYFPCQNLPASNINAFDLINLVRDLSNLNPVCNIPDSAVTSPPGPNLGISGLQPDSIQKFVFNVPTGYFPNRDVLKYIDELKKSYTHAAVVSTRKNYLNSGRWSDEYTLVLARSTDPMSCPKAFTSPSTSSPYSPAPNGNMNMSPCGWDYSRSHSDHKWGNHYNYQSNGNGHYGSGGSRF